MASDEIRSCTCSVARNSTFYNDIVANDKEGEHVFETLEQAVNLHMEEDEYVTVSGKQKTQRPHSATNTPTKRL